MRLIVLAVVVLLGPSVAKAESRVMLSPGPGYRIRLSVAADRRFDAFPRVKKQGWSPVDRWFQVAPGGRVAAFWSAPSGLVVMAADGAELWRRKGNVEAFRFSARGDRLAIAMAREIQVLDVARREARRLAQLAGVDWLGWTDVGLVARTRSSVELVGDDGQRRTLAKVRAGTAIAVGGRRLILFAPSTIREFDLAQSGRPVRVTKLSDRDLVLNVDLGPDGATLLFATAKRVYLRAAAAAVKPMAEVTGVHSLSFSPDGAAELWLADSGGAVAREGKQTPFPAGTRSARFRADGGPGLVLTTEAGVFNWVPADGAPNLVGGISPEDGVNLTGDLMGGAAISFVYLKSGRQKETQTPTAPVP